MNERNIRDVLIVLEAKLQGPLNLKSGQCLALLRSGGAASAKVIQSDVALLIHISKRGEWRRNSVMSAHLPLCERKTVFVELIESGMQSARELFWGRAAF